MGKLSRWRGLARTAATPVAALVLVGSLAAVSGASTRPRAAFPSYPTALTAADVSLAAKYIQSKPGVANGSNVTIGLLNDDATSPEATDAATVGADLVNQRLGGIRGHKVDIDECDATGVVSALSCANSFAALAVRVVLTGALDLPAVTAAYQRLLSSGIPVIIGNSLTPTDFAPPLGPVVTYSAGSPGVTLGLGTYLSSLSGLTKVAVEYLQGDPASEAALNVLQTSPSLKGVTVVGEPVATPWSASDVEAATTAAKLTKSTVLVALLAAPQCTELAGAEHTLSFNPQTVATGACFSASLTTTVSAVPLKWTFVDDGVNPYMYDKALPASAEYDVYVASAASFDSSLDSTEVFGSTSFDDVLTVAKLYNEAGPTATAPQLAKLAQSFKGPQWGIPGSLSCGTVDALSFPSSCSASVGVERYDGPAGWTAVKDAYNNQVLSPYPPPACLGTGGCDVTSTSPTFICLSVSKCPPGGTTVSSVSVGALLNGKRAPNEAVTVHFLSPSTPSSSGSWCQGANGKTKTGHTNAQGVFQFNYNSAGPGGTPPIASFCIIRAVVGKASIYAAIDQTNDPAAWKVTGLPRKTSRFAVPSDKATLSLSVLNGQRSPVFGDPTTFLYSMVPSTVGACGSVTPMVRKTKHPHGRATLVYTPSTVWGTRSHPVTCTLIGQEADTSKTSNRVVIYQVKP